MKGEGWCLLWLRMRSGSFWSRSRTLADWIVASFMSFWRSSHFMVTSRYTLMSYWLSSLTAACRSLRSVSKHLVVCIMSQMNFRASSLRDSLSASGCG